MNRLLKYIVGLTISVASVSFSAGGVGAAPVRCQDAIRENVMLFDKNVQTYNSANLRDALRFCRLRDWMSEMRLYVSPYRNMDDYNYYREYATALRGDNLTEVRKWMCRSVKSDRANGRYGYQYKYPGCGEKP
jgi:hypothetical protein